MTARDTGSAGGRSRYDRRLGALQDWRSAAVADGRTDAGGVRDVELAQIARSDALTPAQVRLRLPRSREELAEDIAGALAEVDGPGVGDTAGTDGAADADGAGDPMVAAPGADDGPFPEGKEPEFAPPDPGAPSAAAHDVAIRPGGSGLLLSWPAADDGAVSVIYRVVSRDRTAPWPPDGPGSSRVAVTTACTAVDDRPFVHARRYVDVWRHSGPTPEQAAAATPVWHARGIVIAPVRDVELTQDGDRVVGQWTAPDGAAGVDVMRIPVEDVPAGLGDPRYRVPTSGDELGGLDDAGVERGRTYLYQIRASATDDRGRLRYSAPVEREVDVAAELVGVGDLTVRVGAGDHLDLAWTRPPAGRVLVYRTETEPLAGLPREALGHDAAALDKAGLPESGRLLHPVADLGAGRSGMSRLPWPPGWNRAHFTPVTVLDGRARVGRPSVVVRTGVVTRPRIVERVHKEVLTFGWPQGANAVWLFQGVIDQDPATAVVGQPSRMVLHDRYLREGGMHLDPPLPGLGCSVHLVPVAYDAGQPVFGPTASLNYQGLLRMHYTITARRNFAGRLTSFSLWLGSEMELPGPPPFVLVANPDRLPLEIGDGRPVPVTEAWDSSAAPVIRITPPPMRAGENPDLAWTADARGLEGYHLRLFADVDEARRSIVAVIDPAPDRLRLPSAGRRPGSR